MSTFGRLQQRVAALRRLTAGSAPTSSVLNDLGVSAGLAQSSLQQNYLSAIEAEIVESGLRDLVIVNPVKPLETGSAYAQRYPNARIHALSFHPLPVAPPGTTPGNLILRRCRGIPGVHDYLTTVAPVQVLIDSCSRPSRKKEALFELLFNVQDGGLYVIENLQKMAAQKSWGEDVVQALARFAAITDEQRPPRRKPAVHDIARAKALGSVEYRDDVIFVRKRGEHLLKLRDKVTDAVLTARTGTAWGQTLDRRPLLSFRSRATAWANGPVDSFRPIISVPELYLREYRDVLCAPRQLVVLDGTVLPISFHHRLHYPLLNRSFSQHDASQWFTSLDEPTATAPHLPGTYYHLDNEFPWHFGHFMTEDIARLWGWQQAKSRYPDMKVLLSTWDPKTRAPGRGVTQHQLTILGAYGIPAEDIVCIDAPVRVDRLIGASQMLYNPRHIHPAITEIWNHLRVSLGTAPAQRAAAPRRLFVSRSADLNRSCRNAPEVEKLFESYGYTTVRPEQLDIPGQVDLFADAEVIAGFGGSAMFNMIYCENPGKRIVLAPNGYRARNEYLISALHGNDYYHFFCPAEFEETKGHWNRKAFFSPFTFDFARDGAALERLLHD